MRFVGKWALSFLLVLCVLAAPCSALAAEVQAFDLMPVAEDDYTIVEGEGTVSIVDGALTIVNEGDGDFRVTLSSEAFDMTTLNTLHVAFTADMPFKMAYHLISEADNSNDWLATTVDYTDLYEVDAATDRSPAGEYDIEMNVGDYAEAITDKTSVYMEQFIILVTGKGTFTLKNAEMIVGESLAATEETEEDNIEAADTEEPATDDEAVADTATEENVTEDAVSNVAWLPIVLIAVAVIVVVVVIIVIVKKRKA